MSKCGMYAKKKNKKLYGIRIFLFISIFLLGAVAILVVREWHHANPEQGMNLETSPQLQAALSTAGKMPVTVTQTQEPIADEGAVPSETVSLTEHTLPDEAETVPTENSTPAETEANTEPVILNEPVQLEDVDSYAPVLQQYREVIMMDSREFFALYGHESELDIKLSIDAMRGMVDRGETESIEQILQQPTLSERYPYVNGMTLHTAKLFQNSDSWNPGVYHYAYYNINGLGSCELLIGEYNDYRDDYSILAIYTLDDDEPELLESIADNDRWHLTIYTDGTICTDGSGGASIHYWDYYRIDHSFDIAEQIAGFTVDYSHPRGEYMAAAVDGYEAMLTPVTDIAWQPLQT